MNYEMNSAASRHALRGYELIEEKDAVLPLSDREVFFNFSVYESIKVKEGIPLFFEDHVERLFESAARLEMAHSFEEGPLKAAVRRLLQADEVTQATLRIQLIGGGHPRLFGFLQSLPVYPTAYYQQGVSVLSYQGERIEPEVKSNCLLLNYIALREARKRGAFESVLVNRFGQVMEGTRSNIFGLREGKLCTPLSGVLAGVTRKHILSAAALMGLEIVDEAPDLNALKRGVYEEFFISSTSMGALPVSMVDEAGMANSFPVAAQLHAFVCSREQEYIHRETSQ
ncbi:MAG: aminotransferase class IV [Spirochaetota bacterium]